MKKIFAFILCAALVLSTLAGCTAGTPAESKGESMPAESFAAEKSAAAGDSPVTVTSTLNGEEHTVTYEKAPERVVSLAGFATELLLALGLEDKIVGYAWQDNKVLPEYEDAFAGLNRLCDPGSDPGEEVVLAAEPDLVLAWASGSDDDYYSYKNLTEKGIGSYGFACELEGANLESVYTDILNLGEIFRVSDKAQALVDEMRGNIAAVQARIKGKAPVSVFVCDVGSSPEQAFTAGGGLVADLIEKAGGKNIIQDTTKNWTRVSWEAIAEANPDYIVIDYYTNAEDVEGTKEFLKSHPALSTLDAVKNDKFIVLTLTDISAGERNDDTVELFASYFHPEG